MTDENSSGNGNDGERADEKIDIEVGDSTTVGDLRSEAEREEIREREARNPSPKVRAALADLDAGEITAQMIDHDVRFEHLTPELRTEAKNARGLPTGETPAPDPDGDHDVALSWDDVDVDVGEEAGEPLKKSDAKELIDGSGFSTVDTSPETDDVPEDGVETEEDKEAFQLTDLSGVGGAKAEALRGAGYRTAEDLRAADPEDIASADGVGNALASRIKDEVGTPTGTESGEVAESVDEAKQRYQEGETDEAGLERDLDATVPDEVAKEYDDSDMLSEEEATATPATTQGAGAPGGDPDGSGTTGAGADPGDDSTDEDEDVSVPPSLSQVEQSSAGSEYPWDDEKVGTDKQGRKVVSFTYKGPTEITEPEDPQELEQSRVLIENLGDMRETEQEKRAQKYFEKLAGMVMTMKGDPVDEMWTVKRSDGMEDYLHEDVARKHGLITANGTLARTDDGQTRAEELGVEVVSYWDGLTEFQRTKLGGRIVAFIDGESSFRPRLI